MKSRPSKTSASRKSAPTRVASRGTWAVAALLALGLIVAGLWFAGRGRNPQPPIVSMDALDPILTGIIQTARAEVVRAPKSASTWGQLGQALHAAEFHAQARICYSNAASLDPQAFRWPYLLGLLELQDQPDSALPRLARATELAAGQTDSPRFQLARALVERGQFEQAAPHLQQILARNPQHAAARVELARVFFARNAMKEATQELQQPLTNQLTMRAALLIVAQMAQRQGQADLAAQLSRRAAALPRPFDWPDPVLRDVQNLRVDRAQLADQANALLQQKRFAEADMILGRLLGRFPDDAEGLLLLGRLNYVQKKCAEAEVAYRRHLAIQPQSLNGLIQLGLALMCQQQWHPAARVLEQAIELKPDFAQAHFQLGTARSRANDSPGAIHAFRDAIRCTPGDVNAHIALAEELANDGQVEAAREEIRRATELAPNDPRIKPARQQLQMN